MIHRIPGSFDLGPEAGSGLLSYAVSQSLTAAQIYQALQNLGKVTLELDSDFGPTTNTTFASITGFTVPLLAGGKYRFDVNLFGDLGTGAVKFSMAASSGLTATGIHWSGRINTGGGAPTVASMTGYQATLGGSASVTTALVGASSVGFCATITGRIRVGDAGSLVVQVAQQSNTASGVTILADSSLVVRRSPP